MGIRGRYHARGTSIVSNGGYFTAITALASTPKSSGGRFRMGYTAPYAADSTAISALLLRLAFKSGEEAVSSSYPARFKQGVD